MKLLHIIASPRKEHSRTLSISKEFINTFRKSNPDVEIVELDLFETKLPQVTSLEVDAKYISMSGGAVPEGLKTNWDEISRISNDFLSYDYYLISSPMWNFTVPYVLKQYIDVIMQAGILFSFTASGVEGLAKNKKMFCITSRGNDYSPGSYMHAYDFLEPYIRSIFGLSGITDISFINAQPMDYMAEVTLQKIDQAIAEAQILASGKSVQSAAANTSAA
jgi:FMN-dependent NADH-azoreductase